MSDKSKHTEGPSDAQRRAEQDAIGQREEAVCYERIDAEQRAARRVRDAAPDLLAVCAAAEDFARMVIASGLGVNDQRVTGAVVVRDAARAAIAKAKGGE